jgi:predicted permease
VTNTPPRLARALIRLVAPPPDRDFIVADLAEDYAREAEHGRWRAHRWYWSQVVRSVIPLLRQRIAEARTAEPRPRLTLDLMSELRQSFRSLRRDPGFTLFVVAVLALGIGANSAMFSVVDRLLLRGPEHLDDPGSVRRVQMALQPRGMPMQRIGRFPYAAYDAIRGAGAITEAAAYSVSVDGMVVGRGVAARRINRGEATPELFTMFGVKPALGRFFDASDNDLAAPQRVVVLGHGLWQRDFAGARDIIGKPVILDDSPYTIIGVAPRGFSGPDLTRVDVWIPESLVGRQRVGGQDWTRSWSALWLSIVVRMKPGVSEEQANAEVTALHQRAYAGRDSASARATLAVKPIQTTRNGDESSEARVSRWLAAVAIIVLIIACANVVNLLIARAIRRQRELAVRLTLGAGRLRLIRQLVVETMTLTMLGALAGLIVAYALGKLMRTALLPGVEWPSGPVDLRVVVVSIAVALGVGLLVGIIPAVQASAPDLSAALKAGVREGGGRRSHLRSVLTVAQTALSVVLLVGAGLFVVSLARVRAMDLGLEPDRVIAVTVQRQSMAAITDTVERRRERERRLGSYPEFVERLRARADVEDAALAIGLPFVAGFGDNIRVPGRDSIPSLPGGGPYLSAVSGGYFATVGTRILRGRAFNAGDRAGSAPVAIINETMAETIWPGEDPLGKCFYSGQSQSCAEVVGIAADTRRFNLREERALAWYVPFGQEEGIGGTQLLVRPRGDARQLSADIRRMMTEADKSIVFVDAKILADVVDPQVRPWRLGATMFTLMGVLALVVAGIGLYSVISYYVANRRHELGVRIALGARNSNIVGLVMRNGLGLAGLGIAAGLGLSLVASSWIKPLLFDTSTTDVRVLATVLLTLVGVSALATVVPALRAGRVNPMEAMRSE